MNIRSTLGWLTPTLVLAITCLGAIAQDDLPRRGAIGISVRPAPEGGVRVLLVRPTGPADRAGVSVGDRLIAVGDQRIASHADLTEAMRSARAGREVELKLERAGEEKTVRVAPDAVPVETVEGSVVTYSSVAHPGGYRLRTIITEPRETPLARDGRSPAFFFIQGIYCASIDRPQAADAVDTRLVHAMAKAGFVTLRVDKPGLGDSEGPRCEEIDFATELEGCRAALGQLRTLGSVDPDRIYIFGHSMGGVIAPYLTAEQPVGGTIVYGTLARTWFEYQLENVRRQLGLAGATEGDINEALQGEAKSSATILIDRKTPGDVWARFPELKTDDPSVDATHISSRHASFFHQLQDLNLAQAWEKSRGRVLAIHGEYDWVTSGADHELIARIVNGRSPGQGAALTLANADHGFTVHPDLKASLTAMGRGEWDGSLPRAVLGWINQVEGRTAAPEPEAPPAPPTPQASAAQPAFPQAWVGRWRGDATSGDGKRAQNFTMELAIAPTDKPDRFTWTIIYEGAAGRQERPYTLIVKDAAEGRFAIDEGNGIVLEARCFDGTLYSHFVVDGNRIVSRQRLEGAGGTDERISVELLTTLDAQGGKTGGKDGVPEVGTWAPVSIQKATLRRAPGAARPAAPPAPPAPPTPDATATPAAAADGSLPAWRMLKTESHPGKQDDVFFITPTTGWYVNGAGKIFKTTDGGDTWTLKLHKPGTYFRCIAFVDERIGLAGNIGPGYFPNVSDATPLYRTDDGGETWTPVQAIDGPPVVGLCALEVLREKFVNAGNLDERVRIVGVGRVGGPATMVFSDDLGKTWSQIDLKNDAAMAFDVHFFDRQNGVIAAATDANVAESRALILTTADAGKTWKQAYVSARPFELTWKIAFPTRQVGYVTIQSYNPDASASQRFVAKTTDGGATWSELPLVDDAKVRQFGIAFVDERRGWVGAVPGGFQTIDGGATWTPVKFGNAVNKIRLLPTTEGVHAFAIGMGVARTAAPVQPAPTPAPTPAP